MTMRAFLIMAVLAGLAFAGAVSAVLQAPRSIEIVQAETPAFPALRANPDAVAKVVVKGPDGEVELERRGKDQWIATSKHGYRAETRKLRNLVVRLSDMHLVEAKTKREELLYRLELEDPDTEDAQSHYLRLADEAGLTIVEAIFGQRHWRRTGAVRNGIYFRHVGSNQAWLAGGGYTLDGGPVAWLENVIIDLDATATRSIKVVDADDQTFTVARPAADKPMIGGAASEPESLDGGALNRMAAALKEVKFKDVRPAAEFDWPGTERSARFETFDGLDLAFEITTVGEDTWMRLSVAALDDAQSDGQARARALSDQTKGWVYLVSPYAADRIAPSLKSLRKGAQSS